MSHRTLQLRAIFIFDWGGMQFKRVHIGRQKCTRDHCYLKIKVSRKEQLVTA
jgi:hypothetical protein